VLKFFIKKIEEKKTINNGKINLALLIIGNFWNSSGLIFSGIKHRSHKELKSILDLRLFDFVKNL
jgi:hypothetical protein